MATRTELNASKMTVRRSRSDGDSPFQAMILTLQDESNNTVVGRVPIDTFNEAVDRLIEERINATYTTLLNLSAQQQVEMREATERLTRSIQNGNADLRRLVGEALDSSLTEGILSITNSIDTTRREANRATENYLRDVRTRLGFYDSDLRAAAVTDSANTPVQVQS